MDHQDQNYISLGPFDLITPIGHGSMGVVWEGVHRTARTHVAIKVITALGAADETFRLSFSNEVRAVARLHHPSIIQLLDYGVTDESLYEASGGAIASGSQYYAMELANGGVLPRPRTPLAWHRTRFLLLEILDALAHAHARDVIHRDIKPSNILLSKDSNQHLRIKLTDFGIAKAVGTKDLPGGMVAGTPRYMAPEQILNQTRDQGPWTDLYSVGCLAYQFATGKRIFSNVSGPAVLKCQITDHPEPVSGSHVPAGFQAWLDRMLAKRICDRYQFAAEAAWDLVSLPDPEVLEPNDYEDASSESADHSSINEVCASGNSNVFNDICATTKPVKSAPDDSETVDLSDELLNDTGDTVRMDTSEIAQALSRGNSKNDVMSDSIEINSHLGTLAEMLRNGAGAPAEMYHNHPLVPAPKTWKRENFKENHIHLNGAGLGLWGLRTIPLVDREHERDAIYDTLLQTRRDHITRTIILDGPKGTGKSRLVEWMYQRSHELALAHNIKALHYADHYNASGVARAMMYHLACQNLQRHEALVRIRTFLSEHPLTPEFDDAQPMLELMHLKDDPEHPVPSIHFNSTEEQFAVLHRFLRRLCQDRATILWLDDFHLSNVSIDFVRYSMNRAKTADVPLLILCTARSEEILKASGQYESWHSLISMPEIIRYSIDPLPSEAHIELVRELIGLDEDLCQKVAERTGGMPLFAIQLIGDWIERGVLVPGPNGFKLKDGTKENLPDSLHEVWLSRLRLIFEGVKPKQMSIEQLELAACLGIQFDADEWRIACSIAELGNPNPTLEIMLEHRLFEMRYPNIRFTHSLLRESLLRYAEENGRTRDHNLACADMLRDYFSDSFEFYNERRANHLYAAETWESCIEPFLQAANVRKQRGEYAIAHELFRRRENALDACKADFNSPIRALGWVSEANAYITEGKFDEASSLIEHAIALANNIHAPLVLALSYKEKGLLLQYQNRIKEAIDALIISLQFFEQLTEKRKLANAAAHAEVYCLLGRIYDVRHECDTARSFLEKAIEIQNKIDDKYGLGRSYNAMGNTLQHIGLYEDARRSIEFALGLFEQLGCRLELANSLNDIGEIYRLGYNQPDAAETYYRRAIEFYHELGSSYGSTTIINLVLLLLSKQRYTEAKNIVLSQIPILEANLQAFDLNWLYAELLVCCAATFDWPTFGQTATILSNSLISSGVVDGDILFCTELATNLCIRYASREQARVCHEIAQRQAVALNDFKAIERLNRF